MSFADPTQTPPDKEPDEEREYTFSSFMGCLIVDGVLQGAMAFWFKALIEPFNVVNFNVWLFWLGLVVLFVSLHWHNNHTAAKALLYQLGLMIMFTIFKVIII